MLFAYNKGKIELVFTQHAIKWKAKCQTTEYLFIKSYRLKYFSMFYWYWEILAKNLLGEKGEVPNNVWWFDCFVSMWHLSGYIIHTSVENDANVYFKWWLLHFIKEKIDELLTAVILWAYVERKNAKRLAKVDSSVLIDQLRKLVTVKCLAQNLWMGKGMLYYSSRNENKNHCR